jgi:NAD/NADP transhydrogenase beta subunit
MAVQDTTSVTRSETLGSLALWFGIFVGPLAWGLQILIGYNVEEIVCAESSQSQQLLGIAVEPFILILHLVLTAITFLGVLVSFGCWRKTSQSDTSVGGRARWMAVAGIMVSVLFLIVIVSGFFPPLFLDACDPPL